MHTSNTCLLFNRSNQWRIQDFCKGEGGTSATGALAWVPAVVRAAATGSGRSRKAPQTVLWGGFMTVSPFDLVQTKKCGLTGSGHPAAFRLDQPLALTTAVYFILHAYATGRSVRWHRVISSPRTLSYWRAITLFCQMVKYTVGTVNGRIILRCMVHGFTTGTDCRH